MQHLIEFLEKSVEKYNCINFIENDPISIPHMYSRREDIEISGFLTSIIAWGNRKSILKSANQLMQWLDNSPYDFILNHSPADLEPLKKYIYRTFNGIDCIFFIKSLQNIYINNYGLEEVFSAGYFKNQNIMENIIFFRNTFLSVPHELRSEKHLANPLKGSSAKRINMFLRWMVRVDNSGVDFGLWRKIKPSDLMIPLDVHSGTIARKLNLLKRNSNDWRAVEELTLKLKQFDANDPVKYDFALFGLGVNGDF